MIQTRITKIDDVRYKFTFFDDSTSNEDIFVDIKQKLPDGSFLRKAGWTQEPNKPFRQELIINSTIPIFEDLYLYVKYQYPVKISNMVKRFEEKEELKRKALEKGSKPHSEPDSPFDKD